MARIGFDMDEVITDTYTAQLEWLKTTYPELVKHAAGQKISNILSETQHDHLYEMLDQGSFFKDLLPMKGAVQTLELLNNEHELFIVTAATLFPNSCVPKFNWIKKYLPFFDLENVVFCMNKSAVHVDYLIDDHASNFDGLHGTGVLFSAPHNHEHPYPVRVSDWADVACFSY
jgi:5'(3')-deoxyribonucleotidase